MYRSSILLLGTQVHRKRKFFFFSFSLFSSEGGIKHTWSPPLLTESKSGGGEYISLTKLSFYSFKVNDPDAAAFVNKSLKHVFVMEQMRICMCQFVQGY